MNGKKPTIEYNLTLDSAKSISMVAGAKARNTNKELKEMSKLVRRYFIIVEKAFKNRAGIHEVFSFVGECELVS